MRPGTVRQRWRSLGRRQGQERGEPRSPSLALPGGNAPLRGLQRAAIRDRLHATKLLQARSDAWALLAFVHAEQERGPTFRRLANVLITLYARGSQERLLNAMLLATPKWATEVRVP